MKVICVDDEELALALLMMNCKKLEEITDVEGFDNSAAALAYAADHEIDVAFLDIDMPGMNGLELSRELRKLHPGLNVVMTTAYNQYAFDAYQNDCSGYILKPISVEKLRHQIAVLRFPVETGASKKVRFQCFGNFQAFVNDEPIKFAYNKTMELLAVLVDANGALCTNEQICTLLWEDEGHAEYFKRLRSDLLNTLQDLGCSDIINKSKGNIGINTAHVDCDYYKYLAGDRSVFYSGKYMFQYSWSEETNAFLSSQT